MKKKTVVKIILDIAMIVVLSLLYSAQALGMTFHEIGGLALIGAFLIHKGLNFDWIVRSTRKLRTASGRIRLMWIFDALLVIAFILVGLSGMYISKVVFPGLLGYGGGMWRTIHYFTAAVALLLTGVHMGLHAAYLTGILGRWVRLPRAVATLLVAGLMAFGAYSIASTGFAGWLSMPFSTAQSNGAVHGKAPANRDGESGQADASEYTAQSGEIQAEDSGESAEAAAFEKRSFETGGQTKRGGGGSSIKLLSALQTFARFFSVAFVFAAITALTDKALRRKRNNKRRLG